MLGVQEAIPEYELSDDTVAATGLVYQPFVSAERASPIENVGLDASYWNGLLVPVADLPALSVQLPLTVAVLESGPE